MPTENRKFLGVALLETRISLYEKKTENVETLIEKHFYRVELMAAQRATTSAAKEAAKLSHFLRHFTPAHIFNVNGLCFHR